MSVAEHLKNYEVLKKLVYVTELKVHYYEFIKQIEKDEDLEEIEILRLKEMFTEYYNFRVSDGSRFDRQVKALDLFSIYLANGYELDFNYFIDATLSRIVDSKSLVSTFSEYFSNQNILKYYYHYYLHQAVKEEIENNKGDLYVTIGCNAFKELLEFHVIPKENYVSVCEMFKKNYKELVKKARGDK